MDAGQNSNRSNGSGKKHELIGRAQSEKFQMEETKSPSNPFDPQQEKPSPSEELKDEMNAEDEGECDVEETTPVIAEWQEKQTLGNRTVRSNETKLGSFANNPEK